jgi:hypothetical protein
MNEKEGNVDIYVENKEFELLSLNVETAEALDPCCTQKFDEISYVLKLKRRPAFFVVNYIFPGLLITIVGKYNQFSI